MPLKAYIGTFRMQHSIPCSYKIKAKEEAEAGPAPFTYLDLHPY